MSATSSSTYQQDATDLVARTARAARSAQRSVVGARREVKDAGLHAMADHLVGSAREILVANAADADRARTSGMADGLIDRLTLTRRRIGAIADSLREIAGLPDPVGEIIDGRTLPNGLRVRRVRVPVGVVGMIYEARPNVTVDVAAPDLEIRQCRRAARWQCRRADQRDHRGRPARRSGIRRPARRPGDDHRYRGKAGGHGTHAGPRPHRRARPARWSRTHQGGRGAVLGAVIETGSGNCHIYVDASADLESAVPLIVNAKTQRVGVCNAAETLLVHRDIADRLLPAVAAALWDRDVVLHADEAAEAALREPAARAGRGRSLMPATDEDWATEYGSPDLAVRVVADLEEAVAHISQWSTGHTEAILTRDIAAMNRFTGAVDSAVVMVNASTRFTDGGQLGLGAELGISTQKLHARGPMGLAALTTTQWIVQGNGHVRPD